LLASSYPSALCQPPSPPTVPLQVSFFSPTPTLQSQNPSGCPLTCVWINRTALTFAEWSSFFPLSLDLYREWVPLDLKRRVCVRFAVLFSPRCGRFQLADTNLTAAPSPFMFSFPMRVFSTPPFCAGTLLRGSVLSDDPRLWDGRPPIEVGIQVLSLSFAFSHWDDHIGFFFCNLYPPLFHPFWLDSVPPPRGGRAVLALPPCWTTSGLQFCHDSRAGSFIPK